MVIADTPTKAGRGAAMKAEQIWQAAQGELQLQMTRATYDTWVKPTVVVSYADGELVIGTPNGYTQEWWQNRLLTTVRRILTGIVGAVMNAMNKR